MSNKAKPAEGEVRGTEPVQGPHERWRKDLESLGRENVRIRLVDAALGRGSDFLGISPGAPAPHRGFVEVWLAEQDRAAAKRELQQYRTVVTWTVIGALAAIVAAVGTIVALFR